MSDLGNIFERLQSKKVQKDGDIVLVEKAREAVAEAVKAQDTPQQTIRLQEAEEAVTAVEKEIVQFDNWIAKNDEKLEEMAVLAAEKAEDESKGKIFRTYEDYDFEKLQLYAGIDCIVTSEILASTFEEITTEPEFLIPNEAGVMVRSRAPAIIDSIEKVEMPAHEFIIDLEINGLEYDVDQNRRFSAQMSEEIRQLEEQIFEQLGRKVNLDSGVEVAELLYREKGLIVPFTTKSGEPATDGEALLTLAGLDPMGGKYVAADPALQYLANMAKRRDINSVHNTFIKTYVEDFVKRDGRIHPSYNLFGTSSFRITGDTPNLTQLPRPKHGYNVRACYKVRDGYVFIAFDFSSAEVKILGALCKDPVLLKAIEDGLDFHSFSASQMLGIPYQEFIEVLADKANPLAKQYKVARQNAKALTFGILYGSSVNGIAMALNLSKDEAERLIALYFKTYPKIEEYVKNSHKMAMWNQYVTTPFGQRKQEYGTHKVFKPTAAYNAALRNSQNVRVQSTTSTLGLVVFTHLNEAIKKLGGLSICTVYDSIEMEVPIERAAEAIETAFYYMDEWPVEHFDFLDLPIGVEGEVGTNWGDLEVVHRGVTQPEIEALISKLKAQAVA